GGEGVCGPLRRGAAAGGVQDALPHRLARAGIAGTAEEAMETQTVVSWLFRSLSNSGITIIITLAISNLIHLLGFRLSFSASSATLREKIRLMEPNEITAQIVDAAYKIHTELGPGLLET